MHSAVNAYLVFDGFTSTGMPALATTCQKLEAIWLKAVRSLP